MMKILGLLLAIGVAAGELETCPYAGVCDETHYFILPECECVECPEGANENQCQDDVPCVEVATEECPPLQRFYFDNDTCACYWICPELACPEGWTWDFAECKCIAPDAIEYCPHAADICIVVDTSTSIGPINFNNHVRPFLMAVPSAFDIGPGETQTQVGLITFDTDATLRWGLDAFDNFDDLQEAMENVPKDGGFTNTPDALKKAKEECFGGPGAREDVEKILVIFTDGRPQLSFNPPEVEIQALRVEALSYAAMMEADMGVAIISVGVGAVEEEFVQDLSSGDELLGVNYFLVSTVKLLGDLTAKIGQFVCDVNVPEGGKACYNKRPGRYAYNGIPMLGVPSLGTCMALCSANPDCTAFTWIKELRTPGPNGETTECKIHIDVIVTVRFDWADESDLYRKAPCDHECFERLPDTKIKGLTKIDELLETVNDAAACARLCLAVTNCTAFQFKFIGFQHKKGCYLYDSADEPELRDSDKHDTYIWKGPECYEPEFKFRTCFNPRPGRYGYAGYVTGDTTLRDCRDSCAHIFDCKAFTWVDRIRDTGNPGDSECKHHFDLPDVRYDWSDRSTLYRKAPCTCDDCFERVQNQIPKGWLPNPVLDWWSSPWHCAVKCMKEDHCMGFAFKYIGSSNGKGCRLYWSGELLAQNINIWNDGELEYHEKTDLYRKKVDCEVDLSMLDWEDLHYLTQCPLPIEFNKHYSLSGPVNL